MSDVSPSGLINKDFYQNVRKNENLIVCDDCKFEWKWKDTILFEAEYESSDKDKFFVIAFKCSQCGKEYLIAVNNGITLSEIRELRRIEKSLDNLRTRTKGKPTPKQISDNMALIEKHKRVVARISKHQEQLKEIFLKRKPELTLIGYTETNNK